MLYLSLNCARYKERLDLKFTKHGRKSGCLDGRKWTLLAGNMDDFRTGVPAHSAGTSMVVKVGITTRGYNTSIRR